jgi:hypothetical protein
MTHNELTAGISNRLCSWYDYFSNIETTLQLFKIDETPEGHRAGAAAIFKEFHG